MAGYCNGIQLFLKSIKKSPQDTDFVLVGLSGLEPLTPALSERCSNQLSYNPLQ